MRIVCAPDTFKHTLAATAVAKAMQRGLHARFPGFEVDSCPVGDGGEGTLDAILAARPGDVHAETVDGPRGEPIEARVALFRDGAVAVIELAEASGLELAGPAERDPAARSTAGTGQLLQAALRHGAREIIVAIGGSATIDGGVGLAQAAGARFFDRDDRLIDGRLTGSRLSEIRRVAPAAIAASIRVAFDVSNPLCGGDGAAAVYGPQKGATPAQIVQLDAELARLARLAGLDPNVPGFGAAGGAGFGFAAYLGASLERGIDLVLETIDFARRCAGADLVITGEGRLDEQSLNGKAALGVARAAGALGVPTVAIVGDTGPGAERCIDPRRLDRLAACVSLAERFGRERAMAETAALIESVVAELV